MVGAQIRVLVMSTPVSTRFVPLMSLASGLSPWIC